MKNEFAFILAYIGAFGLSDIFVNFFKFNMMTKIIYYSIILIIALYFILIYEN